MKLFMLAAGKGDRLLPLTKNTPKSLLDLGDGTTLLDRQIRNASGSGLFDELVIITGYRAEQIEARVGGYGEGMAITTVYNPFYDTTNNLVSLWAAHFRMREDDFMVTNGDNLYRDGVFRKVAEGSADGLTVTLSRKPDYDEDDMKVSFGAAGGVARISKEIPPGDAGAESVGLALVKGAGSRGVFVAKLLELVRRKDCLAGFWLEVFNSLVDDGVKLKTALIGRDEWREVDFHPDVETLKRMVIEDVGQPR
jgi:choline kinase